MIPYAIPWYSINMILICRKTKPQDLRFHPSFPSLPCNGTMTVVASRGELWEKRWGWDRIRHRQSRWRYCIWSKSALLFSLASVVDLRVTRDDSRYLKRSQTLISLWLSSQISLTWIGEQVFTPSSRDPLNLHPNIHQFREDERPRKHTRVTELPNIHNSLFIQQLLMVVS